jgi:hypothetical protein
MKNEQLKEMNSESTEFSSKQGAQWAIISFVLFFIMFASFSLKGKLDGINFIIAYAGVGSHLALLPLISVLRCKTWAKVGGYTWAIVDIILFVAALNGLADETIFPCRLGLHVVAATWPLGVALTNTKALRWAGFALAAALGIVPLLGSLVPPQAIFVTMPFIFIWLGVIIWKLRKSPI